MFWKWFHLIFTVMLGLCSCRIAFEVGGYEGLGGFIFTYLYWRFTYRRLARKERAKKEEADILDELFLENGITPRTMVRGPNLIIAVNSTVNRLYVIRYKGCQYERPLVFTPDEILDVHLSELTEVRKEESGGWSTGLAGALIGGFTGFLVGFLVGRETRARTVVTGYQVRITVRNAVNPVYYLNFCNHHEAEHWQGLLMAMTSGGVLE